MSKIAIRNAPVEVDLEEIVSGDAFRFGVYVEEVLGTVTTPYDFAGMTFSAVVRRDHDEAEVLATFTVTARAGDPGWIDMTLTGAQTAALEEWDYVSSLKVWRTGFPNEATTLLTLQMPVRLRATR